MNVQPNHFHAISAGLGSEFLQYLVEIGAEPGARLPSINELALDLGISSGKLREQLEVARELGFVEVRPKTGIRVRGFDFFSCLRPGLRFALALDPANFERFGLLRNHIEASFWYEAVGKLLPEDLQALSDLMERAWQMLSGDPIQIPHNEHRQLHMTIFSRLNNPFVLGMLEAYWDAYEIVGLNRYADYAYLREVWTYHGRMVEAIQSGDLEAGYQALVEHTGLLQNRSELARVASFSNAHLPAPNRSKA